MIVALAFVLGVLLNVRVSLIGSIGVGELAVALLLPVMLLVKGRMLKRPHVFRILVVGGVWLGAQCLSDYVNGIPENKSLRGLANIGMIVASFAFYSCLFSGPRRTKAYLAFVAGTVLSGAYLVSQSLGGGVVGEDVELARGASAEFWDLYVVPWGFPAFTLFLCWIYPRKPSVAWVATVVYAAAAVAGGARSHGLVFLLVAVFMIGVQSKAYLRLRPSVVLKWALVGALACVGAFGLYVKEGLVGGLGAKTQHELSTMPDPYNPFAVILRSRPEMFVSVAAIADSPLLGHGSWAYDPKYDRLLEERIAEFTGERPIGGSPEVIPAHSVVLGSWVYGGIAGFLFWMVVVWYIVKVALFFARRPADVEGLLVGILAANSAWNLLFSPYGFARFFWPMAMAFALNAFNEIWRVGVFGAPSRDAAR